MKKHFYSHIVQIDSLRVALEEMDLRPHERNHLFELAESNIHHVIIEAILSELSEADKKTFLQHVAVEQHDMIWELLSKKTQNIEEKIKKAAEDLKKELHKDIKEVITKK